MRYRISSFGQHFLLHCVWLRPPSDGAIYVCYWTNKMFLLLNRNGSVLRKSPSKYIMNQLNTISPKIGQQRLEWLFKNVRRLGLQLWPVKKWIQLSLGDFFALITL